MAKKLEKKLSEDKFYRLMEKACKFFGKMGYDVDDVCWDFNRDRFSFVIIRNDPKRCAIRTFYFEYDNDNWSGKTANQQLTEALENECLYLD